MKAELFEDIVLNDLISMNRRKVLAMLASLGQARVMQISCLPDKERKAKLI